MPRNTAGARYLNDYIGRNSIFSSPSPVPGFNLISVRFFSALPSLLCCVSRAFTTFYTSSPPCCCCVFRMSGSIGQLAVCIGLCVCERERINGSAAPGVLYRALCHSISNERPRRASSRYIKCGLRLSLSLFLSCTHTHHRVCAEERECRSWINKQCLEEKQRQREKREKKAKIQDGRALIRCVLFCWR